MFKTSQVTKIMVFAMIAAVGFVGCRSGDEPQLDPRFDTADTRDSDVDRTRNEFNEVTDLPDVRFSICHHGRS